MASEPMASMDDLDDSEAMFGVVLGAARKYVAQKKKRKLAAMLMGEADGNGRQKHHKRIPRTVMDWAARLGSLSERQFQRRYRMPKATFHRLCTDIAPAMVKHHDEQGQRVPKDCPIQVQVSAALRWMAGGSYLDIVDVHGISEVTLYASVHAFVLALINHPKYKIEFPTTDEVELRKIEREWNELDKTGKFAGCVGALDGLIVHITKPRLSDCANPANYMNRKGCFAIIAQARSASVAVRPFIRARSLTADLAAFCAGRVRRPSPCALCGGERDGLDARQHSVGHVAPGQPSRRQGRVA